MVASISRPLFLKSIVGGMSACLGERDIDVCILLRREGERRESTCTSCEALAIPDVVPVVVSSSSSRKGRRGRIDGAGADTISVASNKRTREDWWSWSDKMHARRTNKVCLLCGKHDVDQDSLSVCCVCLAVFVFVLNHLM